MAAPADGPIPGKIFTTPSGKPTLKQKPSKRVRTWYTYIYTVYIYLFIFSPFFLCWTDALQYFLFPSSHWQTCLVITHHLLVYRRFKTSGWQRPRGLREQCFKHKHEQKIYSSEKRWKSDFVVFLASIIWTSSHTKKESLYLFNQVGHIEGCERCLLGHFHYHSVTGCEGRTEFPGLHQQREVPLQQQREQMLIHVYLWPACEQVICDIMSHFDWMGNFLSTVNDVIFLLVVGVLSEKWLVTS